MLFFNKIFSKKIRKYFFSYQIHFYLFGRHKFLDTCKSKRLFSPRTNCVIKYNFPISLSSNQFIGKMLMMRNRFSLKFEEYPFSPEHILMKKQCYFSSMVRIYTHKRLKLMKYCHIFFQNIYIKEKTRELKYNIISNIKLTSIFLQLEIFSKLSLETPN